MLSETVKMLTFHFWEDPEETELWSLSQDLYLDRASGMSSANIREIQMSCEGHMIKLLRRKSWLPRDCGFREEGEGCLSVHVAQAFRYK